MCNAGPRGNRRLVADPDSRRVGRLVLAWKENERGRAGRFWQPPVLLYVYVQSVPASLANHGEPFLDQLPEFHRRSLEVLRQPLEAGQVRASRALTSMTFPAPFVLVGAINPCPCGYL